MQEPRSEEQELSARSSGRREFALDALRGLAALSVAVHHYRGSLTNDPATWLEAPLDAGKSSVLLFFLLSGYVLSLPHWRGRALPYPLYVLRRLVRIYPPYLVAFALSVAGAVAFEHVYAPLTWWFLQLWHTPITLRLVLWELTMPLSPILNGSFWSLRFELMFSALMPLFCRWLRGRWAVAVVAGLWLLLAAFKSPLEGLHVPFFSDSLLLGILFPVGALAAKHHDDLRSLWQRMGTLGRAGGLLASLLLFYGAPMRMLGMRTHLALLVDARAEELTALGALGILVSALHLPGLRRVLEHSLTEYLGRISYSFYLTHMIVFAALLDLLYGRMNLVLLTVLIFAVAIGVAHLLCVGVEEPSIRLGRRSTLGRPAELH